MSQNFTEGDFWYELIVPKLITYIAIMIVAILFSLRKLRILIAIANRILLN